MTIDFYKNITSFSQFKDACDLVHYADVPEDWCIVLTDVQGSTKAIEQGRYKDVNMVGAACIAAITNCCPDLDLPYVFGGDGATILVPAQNIEKVQEALLAVRRLAGEMYDLSLRVGVVPISEIRKRGKDFKVAKYLTAAGCPLAMFQGGGASLADDLVKYEGFVLDDDGKTNPPDLTGLTCRWQPMTAQKDKIMSLMVLAISPDEGLYSDINNTLTDILGPFSSPVHEDNLHYHWPTREAFRKAQIVWKQGNIFKNIVHQIFGMLLFRAIRKFNIKLKAFDVEQYMQDMMSNSDYRKFDDMLRMVVDCSDTQAEQIEDYLSGLQGRGKIVYGIHYSETALMTCFVNSTKSHDHVHFIDGNDGGYALAARQLKQQLQDGQKREKAS